MRDQCILDNVLYIKKEVKKITEKYILIVVGKLQARFQMHHIQQMLCDTIKLINKSLLLH